jgi:hypothetical protein
LRCTTWSVTRAPTMAHGPWWRTLRAAHGAGCAALRTRAPMSAILPGWPWRWCASGGGVLEHPAGSTLWPAQRLPRPGERDAFGGWTLAAPQKWWGHKAEKETWFYVVGCEPREQPDLPLVLGEAIHVVQSRKREDYRPHITKAEREHTPPELALWLVDLARRCQVRPNV